MRRTLATRRVECKTLYMHRVWFIAGFLIAVGVLSGFVWSYGYRQALSQLSEKAEADLELAADRLSTQMQVYQELAVLMATHPILQELDQQADKRQAQAMLLDVADKTAAVNMMYLDQKGQVLVSAQPVSQPDMAEHPAFRRAMQGALGSAHEVTPVGDDRIYSYAAPAFGPFGQITGVLMVVADVQDVEQTWRGSTEAVFFVDAEGVVFISNRSDLLFWSREEGEAGLTPPNGAAVDFASTRVGGHELWKLNWGRYLPRDALHLTLELPVIDMTAEVLVDVAPALQLARLQAAAVAAICLAFGAMLFLAMERRRTLAEANAVLESRVAKRTLDLTVANDSLQKEVAERQEAEAALRRAQADLVQAGKLSALGQMSAGISHELNQPLMAIQQFADNGTAFVERGKPEKAGENLGRISEMAARMARIIKNLRAFARNESEPMGRVDLVQVLNTAVELTEARLNTENVAMDWQPPNAPVYAWGGEVRLVQVFVNLINNAADAMSQQDERLIQIVINNGERLSVTVRDIGPGIENTEKLFEPFYTTKAVGSSEGMGLGLSISYGLVQSFGGNIRGTNAPTGAMFTVDLEYYREDEAA
ncbi:MULTISPECIES: ATP-binding protein [unclassified Ruegeria]|uniref:sensor histidine kinase n=1 Tax=unclassified Ruegeria TaxID=2625375 RepID=UPI00148803A1|nr:MULTISPECIES: ATP-binding protein [unclassified Ruegeria]NOD75261.1 sensor histidine kinase [Ruegeria sp. HKCCD4332]NOD87222.1 sensor histidine kinase [Ruegeria sp. HKCCD4318]NOE12777.1 sensor histidine kinase [Ruegeria sp. HKCCD4318-2]NOG09057.1 sensor histidine kinase [Ruegeria sp. HKCCD4315]